MPRAWRLPNPTQLCESIVTDFFSSVAASSAEVPFTLQIPDTVVFKYGSSVCLTMASQHGGSFDPDSPPSSSSEMLTKSPTTSSTISPKSLPAIRIGTGCPCAPPMYAATSEYDDHPEPRMS